MSWKGEVGEVRRGEIEKGEDMEEGGSEVESKDRDGIGSESSAWQKYFFF